MLLELLPVLDALDAQKAEAQNECQSQAENQPLPAPRFRAHTPMAMVKLEAISTTVFRVPQITFNW